MCADFCRILLAPGLDKTFFIDGQLAIIAGSITMSLPPCLARRTLEGQDRVYYCAYPQHHSQDDLVTPELC
jgi:hypothetical protein